MSNFKLSAKEAFSFGWSVFKANAFYLVVLFAGIGVIYFGLAAFQDFADSRGSALVILLGLVDWIFRLSISIGLIEIPLLLASGQKPDFGHLFSGYRYILRYFLASVLYMLAVVGGLLLLVVPGIIFAMRLQFYGYLIIDKGMKPMQSLKESWRMTEGVTMDLFGFILLTMLLNIAGAMAFMLGLLITAPVSLLALTYVYKKLLTRNQTVIA